MKATKKKTSTSNKDLAETKDDKQHLQPDQGELDLPDVEDIPGQEHIHVPNMKEFADTTASSDDEEGIGVFEAEDAFSADSNVSKEEQQALQEAAEATPDVEDDENIEEARLDDMDEDGDLLNERIDLSGRDLDVPGSEDDDADEEIGEEDEENNSYSLDGQDEDEKDSKQ